MGKCDDDPSCKSFEWYTNTYFGPMFCQLSSTCTEVDSVESTSNDPTDLYVKGDGYKYTKIEYKRCNPIYNSYNTVVEAQAACNLDPGCEAVYDYGCNESSDDVYLCPIGSYYGSSIDSCIYEKVAV